MRRAERIALAVLVALGLAACGTRGTSSTGAAGGSATTGTTSAAPRAGAPVTAAPHTGGPATVFTVRFLAPASTAAVGQTRTAYTVSVTGGGGTGCLGPGSVRAGAATKGQTTSVEVDPARLGSRWCPGTHVVRVVQTAGPVCKAGAMCPQYVRVVGTVGTARFAVTG
ncbi:MAG TPA: hypothetical protein VFN55_02880 [Solirubrobacteraceae bacterium]|nr:hypothetical protein [Solirubrobacteraceae bacterium]